MKKRNQKWDLKEEGEGFYMSRPPIITNKILEKLTVFCCSCSDETLLYLLRVILMSFGD